MTEENTGYLQHNRHDSLDEHIDPKKLLAFGSKQIISLFVPVSICMLMVGFVARTVSYYATTDHYLIYTPFHTKDADVGTTVWQSLANALIMIVLVVVMSIILVLLYKYKCYKVIHGYLIVSTVVILFVLFTLFFIEIVIAMNIYMDILTLTLFIWNFGVVGFLMIHWKGPLILQQAYLIVISAQVALILLKFMPLWTTWVVLGALAIWDLVAVLCPFGPLRILVEIASERNEPIFPALIYSTTATMMVNIPESEVASTSHGDAPSPPLFANDDSNISLIELNRLPMTCTDNSQLLGNCVIGDYSAEGNESPSTANQQLQPQEPLLVPSTEPTRNHPKVTVQKNKIQNDRSNETENSSSNQQRTHTQNNESRDRVQIKDDRARIRRNIRDIHEDVMDRGDRGVKLGLGDFVFYSLLMGRATLDSDFNTIMACYVAILVGMFLTILLLTMAGRALPALPISMTCGILFYFLTSLIISPFTTALWARRVFI